MWARSLYGGGGIPWRRLLIRRLSSSASAVDSILLRSLKDHYLEVSKMTPPPKVNPPSPFTILKGALDKDGPVLRRSYKDEDISISVMRLANIMPAGAEDEDDGDESINQMFLHVDVAKPGRQESLQFLCGLYPDTVGIHSVCLRPKVGTGTGSAAAAANYQGRVFQELDQKVRDAFHIYIEARGINENLFPFLQAWLYVKDHRNLMRWFKSVGAFISERKAV
ncbi:mitochondrial acidic protein MAM33 [Typha angustifolia]|uniref:mitochondrial acidic protein MAM33 n=1 Tax=Typha angustifolia TaxID=59011 RepID=UPI003C2F4FCA